MDGHSGRGSMTSEELNEFYDLDICPHTRFAEKESVISGLPKTNTLLQRICKNERLFTRSFEIP